MLIGKLSRLSGVSIRMLRYYEREGLLRPVRHASGYRAYGDEDVLAVKRIRVLNSAGLTLRAIRKILPCARRGTLQFAPCADLQNSLRERIAELDNRMSELADGRRVLTSLLDEP